MGDNSVSIEMNAKIPVAVIWGINLNLESESEFLI